MVSRSSNMSMIVQALVFDVLDFCLRYFLVIDSNSIMNFLFFYGRLLAGSFCPSINCE